MCSMNTGGLLQSLLLHCSVIAVISVCVCICPLGTSCSVLHRWLPYDVRIGGGSANSSWGNASSLIQVSHETHRLLSHIRQCILWQRAVVCSQKCVSVTFELSTANNEDVLRSIQEELTTLSLDATDNIIHKNAFSMYILSLSTQGEKYHISLRMCIAKNSDLIAFSVLAIHPCPHVNDVP